MCDENSARQIVEANDTARFFGTNDVGRKDYGACPSNFAVRGKEVIPVLVSSKNDNKKKKCLSCIIMVHLLRTLKCP